MDIEVVAKSKLARCFAITVFSLCLLSLPKIAIASEGFLCDATQQSKNQLSLLDSQCPIGDGLWGRSASQNRDSIFWIQCGLFSKPMPLDRAKVLYKHISMDVWLRPEGKAKRCLIGPYESYAIAKKELAGVKSEVLYKEAFIREVRTNRQSSVTTKKPESQPQISPMNKKVATTPAAAKSVKPVASLKDVSSAVTIRRKAALNGLNYVIPYVQDENVQFYMEYDQAWNRLNYSQANKWCQQQQMRLVTEKEWLQLLDSKVMEKEKWPLYLPYWGADNKGLFTNGKVNILNGTSLLNVLCVK